MYRLGMGQHVKPSGSLNLPKGNAQRHIQNNSLTRTYMTDNEFQGIKISKNLSAKFMH